VIAVDADLAAILAGGDPDIAAVAIGIHRDLGLIALVFGVPAGAEQQHRGNQEGETHGLSPWCII
jgi:hypothetical protein